LKSTAIFLIYVFALATIPFLFIYLLVLTTLYFQINFEIGMSNLIYIASLILSIKYLKLFNKINNYNLFKKLTKLIAIVMVCSMLYIFYILISMLSQEYSSAYPIL